MNVWNIRTTSVRVERDIAASPAEVFDAWLDPERQGSPWNAVEKAILQPNVDGLFYRMHLSQGQDYELAHYGRFITLDRPRSMQYTWVSQHTRGLESLVSIDFEERAGVTRVALLHENLPDDKMGRMHEQGWQHYLAGLAEALAGIRTRAR
jgi:uncharacterized protein YndB with AHSA1/START domain